MTGDEFDFILDSHDFVLVAVLGTSSRRAHKKTVHHQEKQTHLKISECLLFGKVVAGPSLK